MAYHAIEHAVVATLVATAAPPVTLTAPLGCKVMLLPATANAKAGTVRAAPDRAPLVFGKDANNFSGIGGGLGGPVLEPAAVR